MLGLFVLLATVATLPPLSPAVTIDLSAQGAAASDVAWLNDDEILVALLKGGVTKVSVRDRKATKWVPEGPLPDGIPSAELIATDGKIVVVAGGGRRSGSVRTATGEHLYGWSGGRVNVRGLAVRRGVPYLAGWVTPVQNADEERGALWIRNAEGEVAQGPLHRIVGDAAAVKRWRRSMHPYGGAAVALPDGSVAVVTTAEPGVFRYDVAGRLVGVLGTGTDELVVDSAAMLQRHAEEIVGRYTHFLDRQPTIDDLVATGRGVAILARTARRDKVGWELWSLNATGVETVQPIAPAVFGPIAHMKCEARGDRLACVTNRPNAAQARTPGPAGSNPTLFIYRLTR